MEGKRKLIYFAWPYANGKLHLGHFGGSIIPADIYKNYLKIFKKENVYLFSGSDMYGNSILKRAKEENLKPISVANKYHKINNNLLSKMEVKCDLFLKTSSRFHKKEVYKKINKMKKNQDIYSFYNFKYYNSEKKIFLKEIFLTLEENFYKINSELKNELQEEEGISYDSVCSLKFYKKKLKSYFFKLTKYKKPLFSNLKNYSYFVRNYSLIWKKNLKDREISREISYGIKFPSSNKVVYVWFEALLGYFSVALKFFKKDNLGEDIFKNKDFESYFFLGKDNIPFHSLFFSAICLSLNYNLPKKIEGYNYFLIKNRKISKSIGNSFDLDILIEKYESYILRLYIIYNLPVDKDYEISFEDIENFYLKIKNSLGNLIQRSIGLFTSIFFLKYKKSDYFYFSFEKRFSQFMEKFCFKEAIKLVLNELVFFLNKFISENLECLKNKDKKKRNFLFKGLCLLKNCLSVFSQKLSLKIKYYCKRRPSSTFL